MSTLTIAPEVLSVLKRGTLTDLVFVLPEGKLDRPLYEAVNKVLNNAGGVWTKRKGHVFTKDPTEALGLALETGRILNRVDDAKAAQKLFQAFYTPEDLARHVVSLAKVTGMRVLEPNVGEGALLEQCYRQGAASVTAIELNPEAAAIAKAKPKPGTCKLKLKVGDFLTAKLKSGDFDRVVMNPPFTRGTDIKHVTKALSLLERGGILVAIMWPDPERPAFQEMLANYPDYEVEPVPEGTFKESGTNIATIILTVLV